MNKVNHLKKSSRVAGAAIAAIAIAGCGGNAASPPGAVTVVHPSSSTLQLAVGTANLFGTETGLNIVSTLRTPAGKSVLVNEPIVKGPFTVPGTPGTPNGSGSTITSGPGPGEINAGGTISGSTPLVNPADTPGISTFGVSGGVFAGGFQPANAGNLGEAVLTPYEEPNYDACGVFYISGDCDGNTGGVDGGQTVQANAFLPIGGPPAFDPNGNGEGTRDGTFAAGVNGVNEGINAFANVVPSAGSYSESVFIPTNGTQQVTLNTSTSLPTTALLPVPAAPTFVPDGLGGGTFAVVLPAGVTDALLNIEDLGPGYGLMGQQPNNCYTNGAYPAYFTIHVTASGTAKLPDDDGVGSPTVHNPTLCTAAQNTAADGTAEPADSYTVQLIGADYPLYASNILFTLSSPDPAIFGAGGSDDITISPIGVSPDLDESTSVTKHRSIHSFRKKALVIN